MPFTEDDLREVLSDRSTSAPAVPELASKVTSRGRTARIRRRAAGAALTVCAIAAVGTVPQLAATSTRAHPSARPAAVISLDDVAVTKPCVTALRLREQLQAVATSANLRQQLARNYDLTVARCGKPTATPAERDRFLDNLIKVDHICRATLLQGVRTVSADNLQECVRLLVACRPTPGSRSFTGAQALACVRSLRGREAHPTPTP
jgi:hypothetical protein